MNVKSCLASSDNDWIMFKTFFDSVVVGGEEDNKEHEEDSLEVRSIVVDDVKSTADELDVFLVVIINENLLGVVVGGGCVDEDVDECVDEDNEPEELR